MSPAEPRSPGAPRLVGAALDGQFPLGPTYLPLSPLTVLVGPNGTGKSTLLRVLAEHLPSLEGPPAEILPPDVISRPKSQPTAIFFVELTADQFENLLNSLADNEGVVEAAWPLG